MFHKMVALKKYLITLISHALPSLYMKSFRHCFSNAINIDIPTILALLFSTYSKIPEEELRTQEANLCEKLFEITKALIRLFNKVKDLQEIAIAAINPFSDSQIINLGLKSIKNMHDFEKVSQHGIISPS